MKTVISPILLLFIMIYFGAFAYQKAILYEQKTTEISTHYSVKEQAKRQLSTLAENLLGDLYENKNPEPLIALKTVQQEAQYEAQRYTRYFLYTLGILLLFIYLYSHMRVLVFVGSIATMVTLLFALISPILMVTIHKEVKYLGDIILSFESKGVIGSIVKLFEGGDIIVGLVLLIFSVVTPVLKLLSLLFVSVFLTSGLGYKVMRFFKMIGRWSMADVFVVALLLVYLTANQGEVSRAEVEVGLFFFIAYVLVSMWLSLMADKMLINMSKEKCL